MTKVWRTAAVAGLVGALSLGLAACGDDDDGDAGTASEAVDETAGQDVAEYCAFSASLDEGDDLPSDDELDRLVELASEEIADQVELVAETVKEEGEAAFGDEGNTEFFSALEDIESYEERECGRDDTDTDTDTDSDTDSDTDTDTEG